MEIKTEKTINLYINWIMTVIAVLAVISLVLEYGFYLSSDLAAILHKIDIIIITIFVVETFVRLLVAHSKLTHLRYNWLGFVLVLLLASQLFIFRKIIVINNSRTFL